MVSLLAAAALAQFGYSKAQVEAANAAMKLLSEGKYLPALAAVEKAQAEVKPGEQNLIGQTLAWMLSMTGRYDEAIATFDASQGPPVEKPIPASYKEIDEARAVAALDEIVRESKGRQIVMLNDAHHVPRTRAFALQLARRLRKEGFTYFAAETFSPELEPAYSKGIVTRRMGAYVPEPMFGDFIRQVERLGFKAVRYEAERYDAKGDTADIINDREEQQAENLNDRIFKLDAHARVFIYCGFGHLAKGSEQAEGGKRLEFMAGRLKRLTGIDPLCVDQTLEMPHPAAAAETPAYRYAIARKRLLGVPTVFLQPDGRPTVFGSEYQGRIEMEVFLPPSSEIAGRPDWCTLGGYRKAWSIPATDVPQTGRMLLQAFVEKEGDQVPTDQVLLEAGRPTPCLMLPRGRYRLVIQHEDGTDQPAGTVRIG